MHTRFILIETSHAGNVGATARAMKVMGFHDLALVRPRWSNVLQLKETIERASGAHDVLHHAKIYDHLEDALVDCHHVCATVMVARDFGPKTYTPRAYFQQFESKSESESITSSSKSMAFLFGSERYGMKNEDVYRCHAGLSIATNPTFGSLNLAAAVQLIAYEWRQCLGWSTTPHPPPPPTPHPDEIQADAYAVAGVLKHWEQALIHLGFLNPKVPKKLIPRLNKLLNKSSLTHQEVAILRGIAAHIQQQPSPPSHANLHHVSNP